MVKIQIELPSKLNRFIEVKKALLNLKDKRETILKIIEEASSNDSFFREGIKGG